MAHLLFFQYWCDGFHAQQEYLSGKIRLSIFLITEVVVGVPAVIWALRVLCHHKNGHRVSGFMISLLLSDLVVLLLNPFIVLILLQNDFCRYSNMTCISLSSFWAVSVIYDLHIQQVLVLEDALYLRHEWCFAWAVFPSCSIVISVIAFISFLRCQLFFAYVLIFLDVPLLLIIILISWNVTYRTPSHISDTPYRFTVLALVTFTTILYVTFSSMCAIMYFAQFHYWDLLIMSVCLMSLNVIIQPLLCVFICRKHTELNKSEVNI